MTLSLKDTITALFLSDSHLGFDMPQRQRVIRRRRGPEFFRAFRLALKPALDGMVDMVVHGGDMFYRSKIPAWLSVEALSIIDQVTDRGIPFFLVPGNHERSQMTHPILWYRKGLSVFFEPHTDVVDIRGIRIAISGFPYSGQDLSTTFPVLLDQTGWSRESAVDIRLLCIHQIIEGACVGPSGYRFLRGRDVIPRSALPDQFAAILCGHVHRHQIFRVGPDADTSSSTVIYSGSTERTSWAERDETKGYCILHLEPCEKGRGQLTKVTFNRIPTRTMQQISIDTDGMNLPEIKRTAFALLDGADPHGIVRLNLFTRRREKNRLFQSELAEIHHHAPESMNLEIRVRTPADGRSSIGKESAAIHFDEEAHSRCRDQRFRHSGSPNSYQRIP